MSSVRKYLEEFVLKVPLAVVLILTLSHLTTIAGDTSAYFSIHVASFKELKNANAFVNSLQGQGKIVFWKKMEVRDRGYFYRIFTGRYKSYADAEKYWLQLKSKGQVSYKGIFSFRDLLPDREMRGAKAPAGASPTSATGKKKPRSSGGNRFVDNQDGTVTDRYNDFMWIKNGWRIDLFSAVSWEEAIEKCRQFKAAGYDDWALPTREQWQSLMDDSIQAPAIEEPNPFKNIIIHMPYWAKDGPIRLLSRRYTALLYSGTIHHQQKNEMAFILPVREIK